MSIRLNGYLAILVVLLLVTGCARVLPSSDLPPTATIPATARPTLPAPSATLTPLPTSTPSPLPPTPTVVLPLVINPQDLTVISAQTAAQVQRLGRLSGHSKRVWTLDFSRDGVYLASASQDRTVKLWDIWNGEELHAFSMSNGNLNAISFSPAENWLAIANQVWDVESLQQVQKLGPGSGEPIHTAFSPDGLTLAVALFNQSIRLYDLASDQMVLTFLEHSDIPTFGLEFSPDGSLLAAAESYGTVRLYDTASGEQVGTFEFGGEHSDVHDLSFSPDGRYLATAGNYPTALIWDVASGQVVHRLGHGNGMYGVAFSPDGSLVATAVCDRTVRLWDAATGKLLRTLNHADEVATVAFSPDGRLLASAGYDNLIYLWAVSR